MIVVIRISGAVDINKEIEETLRRIRLHRKYSCTLLPNTLENQKLLRRIRDFVAYGKIDKETLSLLLEKRAWSKAGKKINPEKIASDLEKKQIIELDIKPFFRLHSPRGGIDSKKHFGVTKKAVLGDNRESINILIRRML